MQTVQSWPDNLLLEMNEYFLQFQPFPNPHRWLWLWHYDFRPANGLSHTGFGLLFGRIHWVAFATPTYLMKFWLFHFLLNQKFLWQNLKSLRAGFLKIEAHKLRFEPMKDGILLLWFHDSNSQWWDAHGHLVNRCCNQPIHLRSAWFPHFHQLFWISYGLKPNNYDWRNSFPIECSWST